LIQSQNKKIDFLIFGVKFWVYETLKWTFFATSGW